MRFFAAAVIAVLAAPALLPAQYPPAPPNLPPPLYVRLAGPAGMKVSLYRGTAPAQSFDTPCLVAFRPGYRYRIELGNLPDRLRRERWLGRHRPARFVRRWTWWDRCSLQAACVHRTTRPRSTSPRMISPLFARALSLPRSCCWKGRKQPSRWPPPPTIRSRSPCRLVTIRSLKPSNEAGLC